MPDLKRLYDEEMRHLLEAGREFARIHPGAARLLALDEVEERDPVVGRLFQSFSFLAGRIRETQEGEEDRLAAQLLEVAAPGWRDPLPSTAIVELVHREAVPVEPIVVPQGSEVRIAPRAGGGESFPFRLAASVEIAPIRLSDARIAESKDGTSSLDLRLTGTARSLPGCWPDRVVLFLAGQDANAWALRYWMLRRVRTVEVQGIHRAGVRIEPAAWQADDPPCSSDPGRGALQAMANLREFFCADERFRFVAITGLGALALPLSEPIAFQLRFDGFVPHPLAASVGVDALRLHAVPVVNRHLRECEPVPLSADRDWYPLQAGDDGLAEILAIAEVQGCSQSDPSRRRSYPAIEAGRSAKPQASGSCSHEIMTRPRRSGGHRTSIAVRYSDGSQAGVDERLLVRAWCGDGRKPFESVDRGALHSAGAGIPAGLTIVGLTRPTPPFRPLDSGSSLWRMLGSCQTSFRDLLDHRLLRETLLSLHWDEGPGKRALIEGVGAVDCTATVRLRRGLARPTAVVSIRMREDTWLPGEWAMIGTIDAFAEGLHFLFRCMAPEGIDVLTRVAVDPAGVVLEHGR